MISALKIYKKYTETCAISLKKTPQNPYPISWIVILSPGTLALRKCAVDTHSMQESLRKSGVLLIDQSSTGLFDSSL